MQVEKAILYIIIPCYNEEAVLPITSKMFLKKLQFLIRTGQVKEESRILFVDDGSKDHTWDIIYELAKENKYYIGIAQSRNRGHQNAVLAGLMEAKDFCDITISIDCDGQDDLNAMDAMLEEYYHGYDIVYGVRAERKTDTFFKRFTAEFFYRLLNKMGAEVIYNHADYRLVSSKVLQNFSDFKEVNLFLRGMFPLVGFRSTCVFYERQERIAGDSHYTISKMLTLAFDGITSLSVKPVHIITEMGIFLAIMSFCIVIWSIVQYVMGETVAGWTSMTSVICFIGGIQLICLGVLGEYIGKIYLEVKARPRYIISNRTYEAERLNIEENKEQ